MSGQGPIQALSRGLHILGQVQGRHCYRNQPSSVEEPACIGRRSIGSPRLLRPRGISPDHPESERYGVGPTWAMALYALGSGTVFAQILNTDLRVLAESTREGVVLGVRRGDVVQIAYSAPVQRVCAKVPGQQSPSPACHVERPLADPAGFRQ